MPTQFLEYFEGDRWKDEVILKKYFFVLQPLLSVEWLRNKKGRPLLILGLICNLELPPRLMTDLLASVPLPTEVLQEIQNLISLKQNGELHNGPPVRVLGTTVVILSLTCF